MNKDPAKEKGLALEKFTYVMKKAIYNIALDNRHYGDATKLLERCLYGKKVM
jgi:hypothetical protein